MQFSAGCLFQLYDHILLARNFTEFVNIIIYRMAITGVIFLERKYNIFTKRNISFSLFVFHLYFYVITNKPDLIG